MDTMTLAPAWPDREDRFWPRAVPALAAHHDDGRKLMVSIAIVVAVVTALGAFAGTHAVYTIDDAEYALVNGPVNEQWVQRTSALLAENPQLADRLARLAQSSTIDSLQRGMVLAALARTGRGVEQHAMVTALATPALEADPAYPFLLARLGEVAAPTNETLAFAAEATQAAYSRHAARVARHGRSWLRLHARAN